MRSSSPRLPIQRSAILACALTCVLVLLAAAAAQAKSRHGVGVVPVHGARYGTLNQVEFNVPGHSPSGAAKTTSGKGGGKSGGGKSGGGTTGSTSGQVNLLTYHGGGVFTSPYRVYDIYWVPAGYSVAAGYQSTFDGFVGNVAAASGKSSNVFYSDTQYYDSAGTHVPYAASFGGSATATDPFPASACSDSALTSGPCLSDNQVANEIQTVAAANGWTVDYPNIFVVLMPKNVANCASYSAGGLEGYCSFTNACAWHHEWGSLFFVVQPYVGNWGGCESGQSPTGNHDADQAINTASHELNESLTDPAARSWFDVNGYENGDKCSWNFGTALGGTSGKLYNQVINGAQYFLQQEWSNQTSKCVLTGT